MILKKAINNLIQEKIPRNEEKIIKINEEIFKKHEASLMNLISGNTTLTNQT